MGRLEDFRREKNAFFRSDDSPILSGERAAFTGLRYFPENPALRFELALERVTSGDTITLDTSTGESRVFRRAGFLNFSVDGKPARLTLFVDSNGSFLPFRDATSGTETYGAGRYLEPEEVGSGIFRVDFNYAYNPYCAYAEHYSCPLPPRENWLHVPIRAGERAYSED